MKSNVYITSIGKFLPNDPINNEEMEGYLGKIDGKTSRTRKRILEQNRITTRYYAIDKNQNSIYSNAEMAAYAIKDSIRQSDLQNGDVQFLSVGSSQGDLILPGFASMVHAETGLPAIEIANLQGICVSGMQAMKTAYLQIKSGEKQNAISCASEFASRAFKHSHYESQRRFIEKGIPFDTDFLRWMLSDGAGAVVLKDQPNKKGLSLKIEWIDNQSYANVYDVCMYAGANKNKDREMEKSWLDYASFHEAVDDGALNIKQDVRLVNEMPKVGVKRFFELIDEGKMDPNEIDWIACHFSSHFFEEETFKILELGGLHIPEERWFTNLYTKGNTGSASIYIILEELFHSGRLEEGQRILCMVPESGRFQTSFMYLTVVSNGENIEGIDTSATIRLPEAPNVSYDETDQTQEWLVRQLVQVWIDFEQKLNDVSIIDKLNRGVLTLEDYKLLMLNIRQQVIDGSQWIARASSYIAIEHIDLRSAFISHARDEHKDYQMLEQNYVSVGGKLEEIQHAEKNIGSEALSSYLFYRASRENPFDLLGAMWIIEGLGCRMAKYWGERIREQLNLRDNQVSFLLYHSESDVNHFERLEKGIQHDMLTMDIAKRIVKTAKVTARLYLLQLEELGNM